MSNEEAFKIVVSALEVANKSKDTFTLQESATIFSALQVMLKQFEPTMETKESMPEMSDEIEPPKSKNK